ncbi:hypothetical protein ATCC90586_008195 [Pythium insidiosum]|nr:hypothetical protein ATCC90586_008195 [Pythium insidiosum]
MQLQKRFFKTHGLAITESCFDDLLLFKASDSVSSKEIFRVLDTNKDGRIDGLEFLAALICVCRASFEDKARFAFELFDFNTNGSLSVTELALLMKSVWIGMALLTGHSVRLEDADPSGSVAASVATKFLRLAQSAFKRYDRDGGDSLQYEEFIEWARSNREFMLQVEQFRLISEKAVGFEEVLSLPDGSDVDSDLDEEELCAATAPTASNQTGSCSSRVSELPAPWNIEPTTTRASDPTIGDFPPAANLQLDWVYGYTGPQTRNTLRVLATGDVVYTVSKYAIVYTPSRHAQRHYCGHRAPITCLDMNAAATLLATGDARSAGPEIHVWSGVTLECLAVLSSFHVGGLAGLAFPAPTILQQVAPVAGSSGGSGSGSASNGGAAGATAQGAGGGGSGGASAASKKQHHDAESLLVSVGSDANASMALWDWQQERLVASGRAVHKRRRVLCVALSEDGSEIAVAGAHFVVFHQVTGRFFKTKKPKLAHDQLTAMPLCVSATYVGPHTVVVGTARGELIQLQHHHVVRVVQAHGVAQSVNVCLLSCRSMVLFTAGKDGVVRQWDSTLRPIGNALDLHRHVLPVAGAVLQDDDLRVHSLAYDAARQRLVVGTRHGHLFHVLEGSEPMQVRLIASSHEGGGVQSLATCRVGLCFATGSARDQRVRLWSLRRRVEQQHARLRFAPSALVYSADGDLLAVGGSDGSIALFRAKTLTLLAQIRNTTVAVLCLRFHPSPTKLLLAVACGNGLVYLYDIEGGAYRFHRHALLKPERSLAEQADDGEPRVSLDFSADGRFLKTQHGGDAGLRFWDLKDHAALRVTNMAVVRNAQWQSYSSTQGWHVGAVRGAVALSANADQSLAATLDEHGTLALRHFPCPQRSTRTLSRTIAGVHPPSRGSSSQALGFALHDSLLLSTGGEDGSVVCQWSVRPCVADEQPRRPLAASATWRHLARFGQHELYADEEPRRRAGRVVAHSNSATAVVASTPLTSSSVLETTTEAPDLDLSMAFVLGMNRRLSAVNQTLAVVLHTSTRAGGGSATASVQPLLVYGAGTQLVALHVAHGTQQSATVSGLQHQITSVVSHVGLGVIAVASRWDRGVQLWQWTPAPQVIATLPAPAPSVPIGSSDDAPARHVITAFHDCDELPHTSPSRDLVAVVWRRADRVLVLRFHRWRVTQADGTAVCLAQAEMTRLPVLFGFFYASEAPPQSQNLGHSQSRATSPVFISGGVDHVTFWRLHVATGHVTAQPGVFGRHALIDTAVCGTHVAPYVLTGMARGAIVLWDNGVAAFSLQLAPAPADDAAAVAVRSLVAVPSRQQLLAGLSTGDIHVLAVTRESDVTRYRANAFLSPLRTLQLSECSWRWPLGYTAPATSSAQLESLLVLDDLQHGLVVQLASGETLHLDASALAATATTAPVARVLVDTSADITCMAVHPREPLVALGHPHGRLSVVALDSSTVVADLRELQGQATVKALAWHPDGGALVASLSDGSLATVGFVLQPKSTTLERRGDGLPCGPTASRTATDGPPKWCWVLRFSPLPRAGSPSTVWLAAACRDYHIYVYKAAEDATAFSLELAHDFAGHTAPVRSLDFSSDGGWLQSSTSSIDRQLLRWDLLGDGASHRHHSELSDADWGSWSSPFAGPVAGLQDVFQSSVTAVARIESASSEPAWQSPLPTIALGTETGRLLLGWYPLPCGESKAAMFKEYSGFLGGHALVKDVAFSCDNAVLVVLATCHDGAGFVLLWRTDYAEELRHRERLQLTRPAPVQPLSLPAAEAEPAVTSDKPAAPLDAFLAKADATRDAGDEFLAVKPWLGAVREPSVLPPGAATSGATPPDADLALEFVYGVNPGPVWYADDAWEIVYSAASFGVVYNTKARTQLRNTAHGGRLISCVAVHPRGDLVVTGEIAAGGSATVARRTPPRLVAWDANSGSTVAQVETIHSRGIALLAFAPSGQRVASVGMDDDHVLAIYALSGDGMPQFKLLASMKTSKQPVHVLSFHDQRDDELVTAGAKHVLFWSTTSVAPSAPSGPGRRHGVAGGGGAGAVALSVKKGLLGTDGVNATVLSAAFVAWHPQQSSVVTGQQDGSLRVWKARQCIDTHAKAHDRAVHALRVDPKRSHVLYSAGLDGRVAIWTAKLERVAVIDLAMLQPECGVRLCSLAVTSLCVRDDRVLFATAGGDVGELVERVVSPPSRSADAKAKASAGASYRLQVHLQSHSKGELWGLAPHPHKQLFVTAGDDGSVRLWDAATRCLSAMYKITASGARCRAAAFSSDGSHVAVGLFDGQVVVLSETLDAVVASWRCSAKAIAVLRYDPDGRFLVIGAHDQTIHVVDAHSYKPLGVCRGHSATVSHLDFSKDGRVLQSTSNAGELLFWQVPATAESAGKTTPKRGGASASVFPSIPSATSVRDTTWATWTVPYGWPVQGIWATGADGSDVNAVCRSADCLVVATGDDDGLVKLFRYPCVAQSAAHKAFVGHASHVTSCVFSRHDSVLLTAGGLDNTVCQFKYLAVPPSSTA